jgi:hypothetical protein
MVGMNDLKMEGARSKLASRGSQRKQRKCVRRARNHPIQASTRNETQARTYNDASYLAFN